MKKCALLLLFCCLGDGSQTMNIVGGCTEWNRMVGGEIRRRVLKQTLLSKEGKVFVLLFRLVLTYTCAVVVYASLFR